MKIKVVIHEAREGGYWAEVPGLSGCVSQGPTLDDVRTNIREAFEGVFEVMQARGEQPEEPGRMEEIEVGSPSQEGNCAEPSSARAGLWLR
jgi:predicted RNase H-like HicB family nuclease